MMALLVEVLRASLCMFVVALVLYAAYLYARSRTPRNPIGDKLSVYACGEPYSQRKASVADANLFTAVWRDLFRRLYGKLREGFHTGVLSDWMMWMLVFLTVVLVVLVAGGVP